MIAWLEFLPARRLAATGTPAAAKLTLVDCKPPATVRYAFEAGGKTWFGTATPSAFGIPCEDLRAGAEVPLVYLATDPGVSAGLAGLESDQRAGATASAAGFGVTLAALWVLLWVRSRWNSTPSA